jgi:hypothetical protein
LAGLAGKDGCDFLNSQLLQVLQKPARFGPKLSHKKKITEVAKSVQYKSKQMQTFEIKK